MEKGNDFGGQKLPASVGFWRWIFSDRENMLSIIIPMLLWIPITAAVVLTTMHATMWWLLAFMVLIFVMVWLRAWLLWRRNLKLESKP